MYPHTSTTANTSGDSTTLDNSFINGNPHAVVIATQNWNASDSRGGIFNNHLGVYYASNSWSIFHQDIAARPIGAAIDVFVLKSSP